MTALAILVFAILISVFALVIACDNASDFAVRRICIVLLSGAALVAFMGGSLWVEHALERSGYVLRDDDGVLSVGVAGPTPTPDWIPATPVEEWDR